MFAIFLMEEMNPFYENISSFPTAIFTFFLAICVLYWLVAVLGFVDLDILDFDLPESDSSSSNSLSNPDVLAGLMLRFGLQGVPVTVIISFITLFGWITSYYLAHLLLGLFPNGLLRFLAGVPILLFSGYLGILATALAIKPIRPLFKNAQRQHTKYILGQTAIVRTSVVDQQFGEASLEDGGAGLILKVRSADEQTFSKGDRVVLLEHLKEKNIFTVVSEKEFLDNP